MAEQIQLPEPDVPEGFTDAEFRDMLELEAESVGLQGPFDNLSNAELKDATSLQMEFNAKQPTLYDKLTKPFIEGFTKSPLSQKEAYESPAAFVQAAREDFQAGGQMAIRHAPEIAATAMTLAFPPGGAIARPAAGMVGKSLQFLENIARPTLASMSGGFGGGALREAVQNPEATIPSMTAAGARSSVEMGMAEISGNIVGKALKAGLGVTKTGATAVMEFAKRNKLPMSPSGLSTNKYQRAIARVLEGGTDLFLPSRLVNRYQRTLLAKRMNELIQELPRAEGPIVDQEYTRRLVQDHFQTMLGTLQRQGKSLANEFLDSFGRKNFVPMKATKPLMKQIAAQAKDARLLNFVNRELEQIGHNASKTAEGLEATLRQMRTELGRVKGKDANLAGALRNAIKSDFKDAGANMTLLKQSDDYFSQVGAIFREGKGVARQLKSGVLQSRDLTRRIFQSGNDDFINQLERQLPPDVWNNLKAQNLADRLEDFSRPIERLPGVRVIVKTDKFKNWVSGNADVIRNVYGQDTFRALQNFAEFSAHAARDISAAKQELAASIAATAVGGTALGYYKGAAGFSEPSVIFGSAGMMAMAHSLMSPNGILKNWLTNGLPRVAVGAEQAAKLGLRFGMSGTATEENAPAYANMMAVTLAPGGPLGKIGASIAGEALRKGMEGEDIDIEGLGGAGLNQAKKELFKKIPGIKASYHAQRPSKFKRK